MTDEQGDWQPHDPNDVTTQLPYQPYGQPAPYGQPPQVVQPTPYGQPAQFGESGQYTQPLYPPNGYQQDPYSDPYGDPHADPYANPNPGGRHSDTQYLPPVYAPTETLPQYQGPAGGGGGYQQPDANPQPGYGIPGQPPAGGSGPTGSGRRRTGLVLGLVAALLLVIGGVGLTAALRHKSHSTDAGNSSPLNIPGLNGSFPSGSLPSGSLPSGSLPSGSLPSGSLPSGLVPSLPPATNGGAPADLPLPTFGHSSGVQTRTLGGASLTTATYTGVTQDQVDGYVAQLEAAGWSDSLINTKILRTLTNADGSENLALTYLGINGGTLQIACTHT
ncbi:hypothetical protein SAMN05892883_1886 [Jatrophihabitans sp. GAS493]|uniref:hypothetical protein n=1 Tax=Jatrophihabitans sp. GAS493 TaxID=1907575 RepID=UPI000BB85E8F|nr:hypothetical protein [Jatrophihabitans sp. GAS493]SOD72495.1 hypothetical protein SAMN05892883_1886 [Jatrophihabitans sp. GAS493]